MDWLNKYVNGWKNKDLEKLAELFEKSVEYHEEPFDGDIGDLELATVKSSLKSEMAFMNNLSYTDTELVAIDGVTHVARIRYSYNFNNDKSKTEAEDIIIFRLSSSGLCSFFYRVPFLKQWK
ncbi:MAG: hypothetical protein LBQ02_04520 [Candidatus Nomurabacteria bacterium]|jgi:hypothetical protein|nr:hypothetical protein [Candidatus Nomurabacteria bacterium]